MGSSSRFSKMVADVFPLWNCVDIQLNAKGLCLSKLLGKLSFSLLP